MNPQMHILYYHSKPEKIDPQTKEVIKESDDPWGTGRRMTVCCLVKPETMEFNFSKSHKLDAKRWSKRLGREISLGFVTKAPMLVIKRPEGEHPSGAQLLSNEVKKLFITVAKDIVSKEMIKNRKMIDRGFIHKKLQERSKRLDRKEAELDRERKRLVEISTKIDEFFKATEKSREKPLLKAV